MSFFVVTTRRVKRQNHGHDLEEVQSRDRCRSAGRTLGDLRGSQVRRPCGNEKQIKGGTMGLHLRGGEKESGSVLDGP